MKVFSLNLWEYYLRRVVLKILGTICISEFSYPILYRYCWFWHNCIGSTCTSNYVSKYIGQPVWVLSNAKPSVWGGNCWRWLFNCSWLSHKNNQSFTEDLWHGTRFNGCCQDAEKSCNRKCSRNENRLPFKFCGGWNCWIKNPKVCRGKSLLELWVATFLSDWQPPLIFVQYTSKSHEHYRHY